MQQANRIEDRYGLPMTTDSTTAAEKMVEGVAWLGGRHVGIGQSRVG